MPKRLVFSSPQALTRDLPVAPDQIRPVRNVLLHVLVGDDGLAVGLASAAGAAGKDVLVFVAIEAKCGACCFVDGFFPSQYLTIIHLPAKKRRPVPKVGKAPWRPIGLGY